MNDEHMTMVVDCETRESKLTDWERTFIDSISMELTLDRTLSPLQVETLEAIWDRVT